MTKNSRKIINGIKANMFTKFITNQINPVFLIFAFFENAKTRDIEPANIDVHPKQYSKSPKSFLTM